MQRVMDGRAPTLGAATLLLAVLALAFPAFASAAPGCPSSVTMDDVHSGTSQFTALTCDDPSGTGLTYSVDPGNDAQLGFVSLDGSGGVSYFPNADAKGHDGWTVVVADNEGGSTNVAFSVDVVNAPPVCQNTSIDATHGQQGFVFPDCSDPDGDGFTLACQPVPRHGTSGAFVRRPHLPGRKRATRAPTASRSTPATPSRTATPPPPRSRSRTAPPACTTDADNQADAPHGQADHAARQLLRHRRRPGHSRAREPPPHGTLGAFPSDSGFGDYTCDLHAQRHLHGSGSRSPSPRATAPRRSASPDFDLTITANHAPQCDDQRRGPHAGRHRRPASSSSAATRTPRTRRSPTPRSPAPGRRTARSTSSRTSRPTTRPTRASAARTASASAPPTARCRTLTTR